ncbi:MAG: hypothetical protein ACI9WU_003936 [Myxococcota bacterium]|jgi:hypothetical protein
MKSALAQLAITQLAITQLAIIVVISTFAWDARAQSEETPEPDPPGLLDQGKVSVGLSGGFGNSSVSVGAGVGYFVIDRLQPSLSMSYSWHGSDRADTHQLRTSVELRYYFIETEIISPFVFVDSAHIYLSYGDPLDEDHNFFYAGGGGGLLIVLGGSVGLTIGVGVGTYLGEDEVLVQRGVLPDGVAISGRFGLQMLF